MGNRIEQQLHKGRKTRSETHEVTDTAYPLRWWHTRLTNSGPGRELEGVQAAGDIINDKSLGKISDKMLLGMRLCKSPKISVLKMNTYIKIFVGTLFIIASTWKKLRSLFFGECQTCTLKNQKGCVQWRTLRTLVP